MEYMTYDHMFMGLLFVISVIALVVGSVALSRDDRDKVYDFRSKSGKVEGLNGFFKTQWNEMGFSRLISHAIIPSGDSIEDYPPKSNQGLVHYYKKSSDGKSLEYAGSKFADGM